MLMRKRGKKGLCLLAAAILPVYVLAQTSHGGVSTNGKEFHQKIVSLDDSGRYEEALETGRQWLESATRRHDSAGIGEYEKAYSYAAQSVAFAQVLKDSFHIAEGLINQGICERNEN